MVAKYTAVFPDLHEGKEHSLLAFNPFVFTQTIVLLGDNNAPWSTFGEAALESAHSDMLPTQLVQWMMRTINFCNKLEDAPIPT